MQIQTISTVAIIGVICSIVLSIGFPIVLMIVGKKKFKANISSFFIGAGTFFVFALVLEQILHVVVVGLLGLNAETNPWLYYLYAGAAAAIFEETGRFLAMKFLMKKRLVFQNAFMYGVGHGGIEAILLGGLANVSNLATILMINTGALQASLTALPQEVQEQTIQQLSALWTTQPSYFFAGGIERVSAVILHIGLSLIVYRGIKDRKAWVVGLAYALHFLVDFVAVACAPRLSVWIIEALIFVMAVAVLLLARVLNKGDGRNFINL